MGTSKKDRKQNFWRNDSGGHKNPRIAERKGGSDRKTIVWGGAILTHPLTRIVEPTKMCNNLKNVECRAPMATQLEEKFQKT